MDYIAFHSLQEEIEDSEKLNEKKVIKLKKRIKELENKVKELSFSEK